MEIAVQHAAREAGCPVGHHARPLRDLLNEE